MIAPARGRLSYLSAEAQWTRAAVIQIDGPAVRLLVADRRPAHAIPLWDRSAPVPSEAHGYQLKAVESAVSCVRADTDVQRAVHDLTARALRHDPVELHLVAGLRHVTHSGIDPQQVARAARRPVHLLTPRRESELFVLGAAADLDPAVPQLLIGIGAETTEVVLADGRRRVGSATLPVGGLALAARHSDPPHDGELKLLRHRIGASFRSLPTGRSEHVVLTAHAAPLLLPVAGRKRGDPLDRTVMADALAKLRRTRTDRLARRLHVERESLAGLAAEALILDSLLAHYQLSACRLSARGISEGVLIAAAEDPDHWWVDLDAARLRRERLEAVTPGVASYLPEIHSIAAAA